MFTNCPWDRCAIKFISLKPCVVEFCKKLWLKVPFSSPLIKPLCIEMQGLYQPIILHASISVICRIWHLQFHMKEYVMKVKQENSTYQFLIMPWVHDFTLVRPCVEKFLVNWYREFLTHIVFNFEGYCTKSMILCWYIIWASCSETIHYKHIKLDSMLVKITKNCLSLAVQ